MAREKPSKIVDPGNDGDSYWGVARAWSIPTFSLLVLWGAPGETVTAPVPVSLNEAAQMGSLYRTAAGIDEAVDVYRRLLVELVPALQRLVARAHAADALPSTAVPEPVTAVFQRLALELPRRIKSTSLSAIPRAYHAEVLEALDALSAARRLAEVLAPTVELVAALQQQALAAGQVVDLYSRQRPIITEIRNPGTALDDIDAALEQLSLAEANIGVVRAHHGSQGEQLQAFLRLEIALGHALDVIAAAEESGIHLGFEAGHGSAGLEGRLLRLRARLTTLEIVLRTMQRPPPRLGQGLQAVMVTAADGTSAQTRLSWPPLPHGLGAPALLRVLRGVDLSHGAAAVAWRQHCGDPVALVAAAQAQLAAPPAPPTGVELAASQTQFTETLRPPPILPPLYTVATVSPFGVEASSPMRPVQLQSQRLEPIAQLAVQALAPAYTDADFYRQADAVRLTWQRSPSDRAEPFDAPGPRPTPPSTELILGPVLQRYRIWRQQGGAAAQRLVDLAPGHAQFVDHPGAVALAAGVAYRVEVLAAGGVASSPSDACAWSATVQLQLAAPLRWAAAGGQQIGNPSQFETAMLTRLAAPAALAAAQAQFAARPASEQAHLWATFWPQARLEQRQAWLRRWPSLLGGKQHAAWLAAAPERLPETARRDGQLASWLSDQAPLQVEVDRWWALLDEDQQAQARRAWEVNQPHRYLAWLHGQQRTVSAAEGRALDLSLRQATWWGSRDPEETERLGPWWSQLPAAERASRLRAWFLALPATAQEGLAWPDWDARPVAERQALPAQVPAQVPEALRPQLLAWVAWAELDEGPRLAAIAEEAGLGGRLLAWAKYQLRPLDAQLNFKLSLALLLFTMTGVIAVLLRQTGRDQGPGEVD